MKRRKFIQSAGLGAASLATMGLSKINHESARPTSSLYMGDFKSQPKASLRAAFIGLGYRGNDHLRNFAALEGTEVVALCDLFEDNVKEKLNILQEMGSLQSPMAVKTYWGDDQLWKTMLEEVKPDLVFISTNWSNHAPMAIGCMENGAHAFVEVPLATSLEELWAIVDTAERTQKHCMMMENVNYGRDELLFLNLCRQGYIGDLLHAEAAYIHELRWQMSEEDRGTGSWRTYHYAHGKGNLYPTHGLGPVAQYMNLARSEDNFDYLVSLSSPAKGRKQYARSHFSPTHKWNQLDFTNGDINTSILKTKLGRTVMVQWDETSPRPYTRHNLIQGTLGTLAGFPLRLAREGGVEGLTKDHHQWAKGEDIAQLYDRFDHPLYKRLNGSTKKSGHGGMDGIMMYRIVECLQKGTPLDQNVYEGAFWSAVGPLSAASVSSHGMPQTFPDFTRGNWKKTAPLEIVA